MTVETNGTVDAEDAIAYSARIFQDQLSMFVNFDDPQEVIKEVKSTEPEFNRNLLKRFSAKIWRSKHLWFSFLN